MMQNNIQKEPMKDKTLFEALKIPQGRNKPTTKERMNFTIDKKIAEKFKRICRDEGYNMSAKIENAMIEIIEKVE
ncbi:MAG: hypothetical protein NDI94_04960 [Candidatus Woesearchaeota archaeon]|nr:hypothetical protein [Candidatus Woesearchaeota archaeon]